MQSDINSVGHTQWFYFRVSNTRAGSSVKFNLMNYSKGDSMFNYGMKICIYSEKKSKHQNVGWHRGCTDVSYFKNNIRKDKKKFYYTTTFTYTFEYDDDQVFFSYCYPYTYSDLISDLTEIEQNPERNKFMTRQALCKTVSGVDVPLLTITDNVKQEFIKRGVVVTARQHPGETVGSIMMKGLINFLTDPKNNEARILRENFVFKIIPMLNPDGVINGNYRCSLVGCDLNRRWKYPSKTLHPEVYYAKKLIKAFHQERTCALFCDLHGHSRKPNVFVYGCNQIEKPIKSRILPFILSKISPLFNFRSCNFGVQKEKDATARVALFKELKTCCQIFTLESTFSGMDQGMYEGQHINVQMLESMGSDLLKAFLLQQQLGIPEQLKSLVPKGIKIFSAEQQNVDPRAQQVYQKILGELTNNPELIKWQDSDESSGSDSEPSEDNLDPKSLIKKLPVVDKTLSMALKRQQQQAIKEKPIAIQPCLMKNAQRTVSPKKIEKPIAKKQKSFTIQKEDEFFDISQNFQRVPSKKISADDIKDFKIKSAGQTHNFVNIIKNVVINKPITEINLFSQSKIPQRQPAKSNAVARRLVQIDKPLQVDSNKMTLDNLCQMLYKQSANQVFERLHPDTRQQQLKTFQKPIQRIEFGQTQRNIFNSTPINKTFMQTATQQIYPINQSFISQVSPQRQQEIRSSQPTQALPNLSLKQYSSTNEIERVQEIRQSNQNSLQKKDCKNLTFDRFFQRQ